MTLKMVGYDQLCPTIHVIIRNEMQRGGGRAQEVDRMQGQRPGVFGTVVGYSIAVALSACVIAALLRLLLWILGL